LICPPPRVGASYRQDFVAHKMKPNYLRLLCRIMKVTLNGLFNHRPQIVDGICFGRDPVANGRCHIAAVYRVLRDLENDFHIGSVSLSPAGIEPTFKV
jgi:hypothetical protein